MRLFSLLFVITMALLFVGCSSNDQIINPVQVPDDTVTALPTDTLTITPEPTNTIPGTTASAFPTSTVDAFGLPDAWKVYYSTDEHGFSFEYPRLYDTEKYAQCQIRSDTNDKFLLYLAFGYRSELGLVQNTPVSFDKFVDRWTEGMTIDSKNSASINGLPAITVDYRFGGLNRFGTTTFINGSDVIYVFNFSAGDFCNLPENGLDELAMFKHAVNTFKIISSSP